MRRVGRARSRPGITRGVRKLSAILEAAFGSVVEAVPEAKGSFLSHPRVGSATTQGARRKSTRTGPSLCKAAIVGEGGRTVANLFVKDGIERRCPRCILCAGIAVNVQLRTMPLEGSETLELADQMQTAAGVDRSVGQATGAVTADSAAAETVQTEDNMLVDEGPSGVGPRKGRYDRGSG